MAERQAVLEFVGELMRKHARKDLQNQLLLAINKVDHGRLPPEVLPEILKRAEYQYMMSMGK